MSKLPELMSGRTLEHDFEFSSSGPMSGLIDGVQTITAAGTITLSFDESNTQLKCSVLSIDPGGADRSVLLPAELSDTDGVSQSLKGRKLVIHNSADGYSEDLTIFESDGTTFVARVGFDSCVEIIFPAHGKPFCTTDVFVGTCEIPVAGSATAIADAIGADYTIIPEKVYISNPDASTALASRSYTLDQGTTPIAASQAEALGTLDTFTLFVGDDGDGTLSTHQIPPNVAFTMEAAGAIGSGSEVARCRMFYRVIKNNQTRLS